MESGELTLRELGGTGMELTTVGFGAWAIGGPGVMGWGVQDDEQSITAIRRAVSRGVNWIDTAAVYGFGHSEDVVGRALTQLPVSEWPLIFTKCGLVWDEHGVESQNLRPESIRRECEDSLRRLGVEQIDLYQIHTPDPGFPQIEESWQTLLDLRREGKVRALGVSNFDVELLERCEALGHVDSLQPPLSLLDREAGADVIPWCAAHGTGVIVYSPLASGLLTGTFTRERSAALPENDWRSRDERFREPELSKAVAITDALAPIAERHGASVSAVAAAWAASWPGVTASIVGARSAQQVDGWVAAADLTLDEADLDSLRDVLVSTGAGSGPTEPVPAGAAGSSTVL